MPVVKKSVWNALNRRGCATNGDEILAIPRRRQRSNLHILSTYIHLPNLWPSLYPNSTLSVVLPLQPNAKPHTTK
jgi:hypothetical protein